MKAKQALAAIAVAGAFAAPQAWADIVWNWSYSGAGIQAGGTLTTEDAADADGFRLITAISGSRNGDPITGLYPTGAAIPGNEPFALDNLIRFGPQGQITVHGFGFTTAAGGYANPFYADFFDPAIYMEVFTTAATYAEVPVTFTASVVPEPASILLLLAGLGAAGWAGAGRRRGAATPA
ncbi:PEP-CTERM sorting domain-containing protein [Pseudorhodoferax aquiterrae]|nr:PEP-CTERM sorting domain-containing protein [Pseudorhodoferax aquiterrae]